MFEIGIYIQKAWHCALRDVFMYKKPDTSQKVGQFSLHFYIQEAWHFALRDFSWNFWNWRRGDGGYIQTTMHFALRCIYKKHETLRYIFICKKQFTLCYVFISRIHRILLIPNYKCTYNQSVIRSINKFDLFIENWSYSYDK